MTKESHHTDITVQQGMIAVSQLKNTDGSMIGDARTMSRAVGRLSGYQVQGISENVPAHTSPEGNMTQDPVSGEVLLEAITQPVGYRFGDTGGGASIRTAIDESDLPEKAKQHIYHNEKRESNESHREAMLDQDVLRADEAADDQSCNGNKKRRINGECYELVASAQYNIAGSYELQLTQ